MLKVPNSLPLNEYQLLVICREVHVCNIDSPDALNLIISGANTSAGAATELSLIASNASALLCDKKGTINTDEIVFVQTPTLVQLPPGIPVAALY